MLITPKVKGYVGAALISGAIIGEVCMQCKRNLAGVARSWRLLAKKLKLLTFYKRFRPENHGSWWLS
jgi:hypothetical protein